MAVRRFRSIPFRLHPDLFISAAFDLGMIDHLLHLCNSFTQFSDGNKAATYNSLQKNIIEMNFCYIYCVSTPFILVFIIIFNIFKFNHFDPK